MACECGCGREATQRFIRGHNRRRPEAERFWEKVDAAGVCWEWIGASHEAGYGRFNSAGRITPAHRWAYEHLVGPIGDGLHLDHLCRNPPCVNPDHLEPVTPKENTMRGYGAATRGARGVRPNPHTVSSTAEYKRIKDREYMADPMKRERKLHLQRLRRAAARNAIGNEANPNYYRPDAIHDIAESRNT